MHELANDVLGVDIDDNEGVESNLRLLAQLLPDKHDRVSELLLQEVEIRLDTYSSTLSDGFVNITCPMDLTSVQDTHSWMLFDPFCSWSLCVLLN